MKLQTKNIYQGKDGRWRAYCIDENGKPRVVSYPRILMEEKLGRPLEPNEDVHHKDENTSNNDIDNLEIKKHGLHQREHFTKYIDTTEICMICGNRFIMTANSWCRFYADLSRIDKKKRLLCCSRSCSSKAGSGVYEFLYNLDERLQEVSKLWLK